VTPATLPALLQPATAELFSSLPRAIQLQLLLERDAHGNVAVSQIETEKLLHGLLELRLTELRAKGECVGG
jgi:pyrophosphate--fructose-6-phosphate 1-phosphotransferase